MQVSKILEQLNNFQKRYSFLGFSYAIIKKYGEDTGGYQAALITYYGFLSLFPLLLVALTLIQLFFASNSSVRHHITASIRHYFPQLSSQLQSNIHIHRGEGIGLAIALLITLYGARGGVNALIYTLNNIWHVPQDKRGNFITNLLHDMSILVVSGVGLIIAALVSGFSSTAGHNVFIKLLSNIAGVVVLATILLIVSRIAITLPPKVQLRDLLYGNIVCAVLIQLLLTFGGIIVAHELKNLESVYGTFATVLGLLFWIYLLAEVFIYTAEANSIRHWHLWPRSLINPPLFKADKQAHNLYLGRESYLNSEDIQVKFKI